MLPAERKFKRASFDAISSQHGGYYRHGFIDHAYLYNLYFPPEPLLDHLRGQIRNLVLNYPVAQSALAALMQKIIKQPADRIVVGNGASELIKILSGNVSRKLLIPVPSFNEYANAAPAGKVIEFPLEFPTFQLDVDKFAARAISEDADVVVLVTPNNPTSLAAPKPDIVRLLTKLKTHDCMVVVDESFLDFADNPDQLTMQDELDHFPNLAVLKSMSKAYGICGIRLGYLLSANQKFTESVRKGVHIWNVNGFAEEFLRMLPEYEVEFSSSCKQVRSDRQGLYEKLCQVEGFTVFKPDANFVYIRLPDDSRNASIIARSLFENHNMYVKDCAGKTQPDAERYLRIASRTETENRHVVDALIDVLESGT
jgi:threonine-phosphate decarboxylase